MAKEVPGNQDAMLVVAEGGQFVVRDFELEGAVNIIERDLHLQNALNNFSYVNMLNGLAKAVHTPARTEIVEQYGDSTDLVVERARTKQDRLFLRAKNDFARAFGMYTMVDVPPADVKASAREDFADFYTKFGPSYRVDERLAEKKLLQRNVELLTSQANREAGLRPHATVPVRAGDLEQTRQERMMAILGDPRAGFLPATHREKNIIMSWLDYMDNPEFELGINDQLYEIYRNRANATHLQVAGEEAMRSVAYTIVDFAQNARTQLAALRSLQDIIIDCPNPAVSLQDEAGEGHPGFAPLIRLLDINEHLKTGKIVGLRRSPMRTREDREGFTNPLERHKVVEDQYTAKNPTKSFAKRLATQPSKLLIGDMREAIQAAIDNEARRLDFMEARLEDMLGTGQRRKYRDVRKIAQEALDEFATAA